MPLPVSYAHAARLPEGEHIDIGSLFKSATGPIEIEIGPGRGMFIVERLTVRPDVRMLGFEIRLKHAAQVDERLGRLGFHDRGRVLAEDAKDALRRLVPDGSVSAFFVHFPDPWWKKRHEKRLVVGDVLLTEMQRLLAPGGELFVQTDVEERALRYEEEVMRHGGFAPAGDEGCRLMHNPYGARSNRERRADEDGLPVHRMRFLRR